VRVSASASAYVSARMSVSVSVSVSVSMSVWRGCSNVLSVCMFDIACMHTATQLQHNCNTTATQLQRNYNTLIHSNMYVHICTILHVSASMTCVYVYVCVVNKTWDMRMRREIWLHTLQHTATHCSILPYTATHCNVLRHRGMQMRREIWQGFTMVWRVSTPTLISL